MKIADAENIRALQNGKSDPRHIAFKGVCGEAAYLSVLRGSEMTSFCRQMGQKLKYAPVIISLKEIEEEFEMGGRNGIMSDRLKMEIARELGVYDTVKSKGWGDVSSRDCGNIVRKAIEKAERSAGSG